MMAATQLIMEIPDPALVIMIGSAGAGKTTFCSRNFRQSEIVSSDHCRKILTSSEKFIPQLNKEVFKLFHGLIEKRLARGKTAVADSTALFRMARAELMKLAERHGIPTVGVVLETSLETCIRQDASRPRVVGERIIASHARDLQIARSALPFEEFDLLYTVNETNREQLVLNRTAWDWEPPSEKLNGVHPPTFQRPAPTADLLSQNMIAFDQPPKPPSAIREEIGRLKKLALLRAFPCGHDVGVYCWKNEDNPAGDLPHVAGFFQGTEEFLSSETVNSLLNDLHESSYFRRKQTELAAVHLRIAGDEVHAVAPAYPPPIEAPDHHDYFWEFAELPAMSPLLALSEMHLHHPARSNPSETARWISEKNAQGCDVAAVVKEPRKAPTILKFCATNHG